MNKKTLITSLLALFVVTSFAGWFLLRAKMTENPMQNVVDKPVPPVVVETSVTEENTSPVDTSDWKIYRNEEYGFEVKYPKEWIVKTSPPAASGGYGGVQFFQNEVTSKPIVDIGMFEPANDPRILYEHLTGVPNSNGRGEIKELIVGNHKVFFGKEVNDDYTDFNYAFSSTKKTSLFVTFRAEQRGQNSRNEYLPIIRTVVDSIVFIP